MVDKPFISAVNPTVFFVREDDRFKQVVNIEISSPIDVKGILLRVACGTDKFDVDIGGLEKGTSTRQVTIPDIRDAIPVRFSLLKGSETLNTKEFVWKPGKHWRVYLVQVSHHDLGYTDLPSNVLEEYNTFFDSILRMCRDTDDWPEECKFRYTVEQAWSILHYFKSRPPEVIEEMVQRIKEGRVEVTALIGNQISEIHGPEELVRALYPAFRLKHEYGIPITTAELNDVPGLSWGLVTVLANAGIKYFSPGLPTYFDWDYHVHTFWDVEAVLPKGDPDAFWWESQEGKKVLFWYGGQGAGGTSDPMLPDLANYLKKVEDQGYPYESLRYWVQGGWRDNAPPILDFAITAREWNKKWAYPQLICGTSAMFFEDLAKQIGPELRTYRGELPGTDYPIGALSTAFETALNRVTHDVLLSAERFASVASKVSNYNYPSEALQEAYNCTLLFDEHTWAQADPSGPAEGGDLAYKLEMAYRAAALAHDVVVKALNKIVDQIALSTEGYHIIVFNPLPHKRTDLVHAELRPAHPCSRPMVRLPRTDGIEGPGVYASTNVFDRHLVELPAELSEGKFFLVDTRTGKEVPFQIKQLAGPRDLIPYAAEYWALGQKDRRRLFAIEFIAENLPAMGYAVYRIVPAEQASQYSAGIKVGETTLENDFYKVSLDPETGAVVSIFDKELERELIDSEAPHKLNQLIVRSAQTHEEYPLKAVEISKGMCGPLSGSLVITATVNGCPQVTQEVKLYANIKRIDFATRILKDSTPLQEIFIAFPFKSKEKPRFKYESALTVIEPTVDQFPGSNTDYYAVQHWANLLDGGASITLVSRDSAIIEFGGLWPGYVSQAHHCLPTPQYGHDFLKPGSLEKGWMYSYILNGNFQTNFRSVQVSDCLFRYSLTSGNGDWRNGKAKDFGYSVCLPLETVYIKGPKDGLLPPTASFCCIEQPNVVLLTLKHAEDGDGLILRLWESEGKDTTAVVHLPFLKIKEAWETNLVEENQRELPVQNPLVIPLKAYGVTSVRLRDV
jgi:alpha-mannosidase